VKEGRPVGPADEAQTTKERFHFRAER
jgi:hypothetical protein